MPRVVHFEMGAEQPERAAKFYTEVFGWKIFRWEGPQPYWLVTTGEEGEPGINGGILNRSPGMPPTVNTVQVESIDDTLARVNALGGSILRPKAAIPNVGWLAYCADTEGNIFGLMQPDPNAR
jgi:uncharacterized protein